MGFRQMCMPFQFDTPPTTPPRSHLFATKGFPRGYQGTPSHTFWVSQEVPKGFPRGQGAWGRGVSGNFCPIYHIPLRGVFPLCPFVGLCMCMSLAVTLGPKDPAHIP